MPLHARPTVRLIAALIALAALSIGCATNAPQLGSSNVAVQGGVVSVPDIAIEGTYQVQGGPDAGSYMGAARISRSGEAYIVEWNIVQGGVYTGIGLREGNTLSVGIRLEGEPSYLGVIVYQISDGPRLEGVWTVLGAAGAPLTELLTPTSGAMTSPPDQQAL